MRVLAYDPCPDAALAASEGFYYVPLDELYARSDVISLHCPLNDSTRYMIGDVAIAQMKPGVVLINTGRGQLIHTEALIDGLKEGRIAPRGWMSTRRRPPTSTRTRRTASWTTTCWPGCCRSTT